MLYTLRFFLFKMQFGSCIIHILYTGCDEIKKVIPAPKVSVRLRRMVDYYNISSQPDATIIVTYLLTYLLHGTG